VSVIFGEVTNNTAKVVQSSWYKCTLLLFVSGMDELFQEVVATHLLFYICSENSPSGSMKG